MKLGPCFYILILLASCRTPEKDKINASSELKRFVNNFSLLEHVFKNDGQITDANSVIFVKETMFVQSYLSILKSGDHVRAVYQETDLRLNSRADIKGVFFNGISFEISQKQWLDLTQKSSKLLERFGINDITGNILDKSIYILSYNGRTTSVSSEGAERYEEFSKYLMNEIVKPITNNEEN